jgi:quercetin dioxygenase-like cupin family protein
VNERFHVTRVGELPEIPVTNAGITWRPIRKTFGIDAFGINAYTGNAGEGVVEEHTEKQLGHQEVYVVLTGHARFELDGESHDAPAGTIVVIPEPAVKRHAVAEEDGTTVLAIGGKPGEAYEPSAWEWYFGVAPLVEAGRFDEALAVMYEGLAAKPDNPAMLYNLACYEALAGKLDEATEHAKRSFELEPKFREFAAKDSDFDAIRDRL